MINNGMTCHILLPNKHKIRYIMSSFILSHVISNQPNMNFISYLLMIIGLGVGLASFLHILVLKRLVNHS